MTTFYSKQTKGILNATGAVQLGNAAFLGGKIHALAGSIDLSVETVLSGDKIVWGKLPKGAVPIIGYLTASATMGASATLDVGSAASAAKYRAAAVFTAVDTPTAFGKATALMTELAAEETIQSVIAVANLPTSGTLDCVLLYTFPHGG